MVAEFLSVIGEVELDLRVRVVVVTNEGTKFCAGVDLAEDSHDARGASTRRTTDLAELLNQIMSSPKPFVGRLNGHCVAGGLSLAAAMDISIAVSHEMFGFTEVRIGVAPAIISVVCLVKIRRVDAKLLSCGGIDLSPRRRRDSA